MAGTMTGSGVAPLLAEYVSMESGLDGRNNYMNALRAVGGSFTSQWSPA